MHDSRFVQPLENRRLMSVAVIDPIGPTLINEPVTEFADISQKVRIAYLPGIDVGHVSQLHGAISWGDNTISPASFERDKNGGIDVVGTHTYAKPGTFSISSFITETPYVPPGGGVTPQYILDLGNIATKATVSPTPAQLTETAAKPFTATLGKFNQFTLDVIFTAKINWGDGITTTAALTGGDLAQGNWTITGSHTYAHTGDYTVNAYVYSQVAGSKMVPYPFKDFVTLIHVLAKA